MPPPSMLKGHDLLDKPDTKPDLHLYLAGPRYGGPSFDDILMLTERLSGRKSTPEEIERARKIHSARAETRKQD